MVDPGVFGKRPKIVQRTSSVDTRSEITRHTWTSLVSLLKPREFLVTVDHSSIWRKHLSWAKSDGSELRSYLTQRFGTNMVFMSLLLGAEVNVLFNSSHVTTQMRQDMQGMNHYTPQFWVGIVVICSVVLTLGTLLTTFTAWGMVSSISDANTHALLRSSIGQYVCFLPSRLIVMALYSFLIWVVMFIFILMPHIWGVIFLTVIFVGFLHIVTVFSAFGRLVMHSGAMGSTPIFDTAFEEELLPRGLHTSLLFKAMEELRKGTSVTRQYKNPSRPIGRVDPAVGKKTPTAIRFDDDVLQSLPEESFRDSIKLDGPYDLPQQDSVTNVLTPTALNRWISQDEEDSPAAAAAPPQTEIRRTVSNPHPHVQSLNTAQRPPRMPPARASRRGAEQRCLSEDHVTLRGNSPTPDDTHANARPSSERKLSSNSTASKGKQKHFSFTDSMPRPSLLNAGGHTLKSIRRMAASFEEDGNIESQSPHSAGAGNHAGVTPTSPSSKGSFGRDEPQLDLYSVPSGESDVGSSKPPRPFARVASGDESQQLLPKPGLRPPLYNSNDSGPQRPMAAAADDRDCRSGDERDHFHPSQPNKGHGPRARTATAEIIDIVSQSVSPGNALRTASFDGDKQEDELESLL